MTASTTRFEFNGVAATAEDLHAASVAGYGHFTTMQVRAGAVRGLDLHLRRLDAATRDLFGHGLDPHTLRGWLRRLAPADGTAATLRVNVFARRFDRNRPELPQPPDVMISASAARLIAATAVRLQSVRYVRERPAIKHLGVFALLDHRRAARRAGFDDALLVGADGAICEGTFWNVGFVADDRVVWPDGPALEGVSMRLIDAGLRARGISSEVRRVALADVGGYGAAFLTNATRAVLPIAAIDATTFAGDVAMLARIEACHDSQPWQAL